MVFHFNTPPPPQHPVAAKLLLAQLKHTFWPQFTAIKFVKIKQITSMLKFTPPVLCKVRFELIVETQIKKNCLREIVQGQEHS